MVKILVTGGCGFIGSNFIKYILGKYPDYLVTNLDALTYAGNPENLRGIAPERYNFIHGGLSDKKLVETIIGEVDAVVNFAAETHVDRSISDAAPFLTTNVLGLHVLLDAARRAGVGRFVHISTDEVYGSLETDDGLFTEETHLSPNSPYSASKASGDLLAIAFWKTFSFPVTIVRPSNNYGPNQYPEKLIPLMITNLIEDVPIPVYGEGKNVRDWLHVEDNCRAIDLVLHGGRAGSVYNAGGECQKRNIEIVGIILDIMGKDGSAIRYVADRPGHDYRYALDNAKIGAQLGYSPRVALETGLENTVRWYVDNQWWWKPLKAKLRSESRGFWTG
ncbi:MAG: dTDP-glucose 4,6-dehydratase [Nitrospirae bacterium]|nr:dTDP-glucose 4,6-dehydratase [Nitrospirota bacterium]